MSDELAYLLKTYAACWEVSISDVINAAVEQTIHQHSTCCKKAKAIREGCGVALDKRHHKKCWGYPCRTCRHDAMCRVGLYDGIWEIADCYKHLLTEDDCLKKENEGKTDYSVKESN